MGKCFVGDVLSEAVSTSVPYRFQMGADCISLNKQTDKKKKFTTFYTYCLCTSLVNRKRLAHKCHTLTSVTMEMIDE